MTFDELIKLIELRQNVAVDCKSFYICSTTAWVNKAKEKIEYLKSQGVDLKTDKLAIQTKQTASEIVEALSDQKNIFEADYLLSIPGTIYPLKN